MKKEILKEIGCYAGCIGFIFVSGYLSGFFRETSYETLSHRIVSSVKASGIEQYINQERSPRKKTTVYKNYRPRYISNAVLNGSASSGTWKNIFVSNKKVVFYLYDKSDAFHSSVSSFISKNSLYKNYNFEPYSLNEFNNMRSGQMGATKICKNLEECNEVREKASDYTMLTNFLSNCGKTMCIINPAKNQYLQLKKRNVQEAQNMLNGLKNW